MSEFWDAEAGGRALADLGLSQQDAHADLRTRVRVSVRGEAVIVVNGRADSRYRQAHGRTRTEERLERIEEELAELNIRLDAVIRARHT